MRFPSPWKMNKRAAVALGTIGMSLAGCAQLGVEPVSAASAEPSVREIGGGCVWPGAHERATYFGRNGDLYQVELQGPTFAHITASIKNGGVLVFMSYNADAHDLTGPYGPLHIDNVAIINPNVTPPSTNELLHDYPFKDAARMMQWAFYEDPSKKPNKICSSAYNLNGYYTSKAPTGPKLPRPSGP